MREEEAVAGAIVQRLSVRRETLAERSAAARAAIAALEARIAQIDRDAEREGLLNRDAGDTIARLGAEAEELRAAMEGQDAAVEAARTAASAAAAALSAREAALATVTEDLARLSARHQAVARRSEEAAARLTRAEAEAAEAEAREAAAGTALAEAAEATRSAATDLDEAQRAAARAESAMDSAEAARDAAQEEEGAARMSRAEAEGAAGTIAAEVEALTRLLARGEGEADSLLDRVEVAAGFEAAFGAAFGDDLQAGEAGENDGIGWVFLPPQQDAPHLPDGVAPLGDRVTAPDVLSRALAQVGIVDRQLAARLQARLAPGQVLVSEEGDLWRWDGFRAGAGDAPSSAALRLRQANRLAALRRDLEASEARAAAARTAHEDAAERLGVSRADEAAARDARRAADRALTEAGRALARAEAEEGAATSRREAAGLALTRHEGEGAAAREALAEAEAAARDLDPLGEARAELDGLRVAVEDARGAMMAARAEGDNLAREATARTERADRVARDLARWRDRLESADGRLAELTRRRDAAEVELRAARQVPAGLDREDADLAVEMERSEARSATAEGARRDAEEALRAAEAAAREAERAAGTARELRARAEARLEAAQEGLAAAESRIAEVLDRTPAALAETLGGEDLPSAEAIEAEIAELRRRRDALGAVNLRAEADAEEAGAEHDTLATERADLAQAVDELRSGIAALNREGRQRLLGAFDTVNDNFATLFRHLFQGGEARLELVESDDPLEAGLEILCQPPGKKLAALSLLSGGEQTLTALALIFAVFLANPAPICVLDEVDAPLDDANVARFCDMLDEMTRRTSTRFLIITHHAVTMSRMDRLFGVTMAEQGVSQLVSVDLRDAAAMVA
jgi:chromosome segregation protein